MIAEQLKKSILQAAIQGKLTQQLPEDGDARDLLKEIQKEKARLIKEGKIKKDKPMPEITEDEIPFEIPGNWCWCKINDIAFVTKLAGFEYTKSIAPNLCDNGIPLFKGKNIQNGRLVFDFESYIPDEVSKELPRSQLNKKCLLTPYVGTIGNIAIFEGNFKAHLGSNVGKIEIYNNYKINVLEEYLLLFLLSSAGLQQLSKYKKSTAQESISIEAIRDSIVSLPPINEQKRIIECIEELLARIESLKNDETKLEELQKSFPKKMKDAILQYAIQGKLTHQLPEDGDARDLLKEIQKEKARLIKEGKIKKEKPLPKITEDEIPFEIPENWCWVRLGEITDYGVGKQVSAEKIQPNSWILELEDIEKETFKLTCKRFDREPGSSKNAFSKGCVLYGKLRPYLKKVIIADESGYCSTEIIPFNGYGNINSSYLKYCMVAPSIDSNINQITHGMDMPRLGTDKAKLLCIPLPPLAEQKRIVDCLEGILPFCEGLQ